MHVHLFLDGRDLAWDWMTSNWDNLAAYFDINTNKKLGTVIGTIAESLNRQDQLDRLNKFLSDHQADLGASLAGVKSAIQTVKQNVDWMDKHFQKVSGWLKQEVARN